MLTLLADVHFSFPSPEKFEELEKVSGVHLVQGYRRFKMSICQFASESCSFKEKGRANICEYMKICSGVV